MRLSTVSPRLPSPLEGEGARRADEGLLAAIAERDQAKGKRARPEWRTATTKRLRGFAKSMGAEPTEAERRLWALLRDRRLARYKFRRQVPIGRYIVDTVCTERRLIIELDGSQHAESEYDVAREINGLPSRDIASFASGTMTCWRGPQPSSKPSGLIWRFNNHE